ncbi:hypothetical protein Tco_0523183 [Tanacetum coccineum]
MMDADRLLAERLQAKEQEELTDEEKARLFVELLEKRKKHFAALRAQEKRNKPPTKAQKKTMTRVNMFVDMDTELEKAKKQKIDDDQEEAKLKELMEVIYDEEGIAIDVIPLSTKPPSIVDYKIIKEAKIIIYQIIRADGSSKKYSAMLTNFDREDLETLWKIVKARHGYIRLEEGYKRVLWCQVSDLQQDGSPDQELQKPRANHWKQLTTSISDLSCLWGERALQKSMPKSKQQCPRKSILAEGQEISPRPERSHEYAPSKPTSS